VLTLVLTRHGSTPRSDPEQHLGQGIDIGLSDAGRAAARALAARLSGIAFDRIVASPLLRATETVEFLAAGRTVALDQRVAEMDYGEWEGLTYAEIEARDPELRRRWEADPAELRCPGGESGNDVAARVRSFLGDATGSAGAESRVLVVAHATLNRILLCVALGVPVRDFRRRFRQDPANLTVLRFPGTVAEGALLVLANDTSHVHAGPFPGAAGAPGAPSPSG
jgi:broad specificity phosphatase PhoE